MLSNPTCAGMIHNGPGRLPGQHEAIVDGKLFEHVRAVIESRRSRKPGRTPARFLFPLRRLLKCGRCQRAMILRSTRHKNFCYYFYRCRSRAGGKAPCRGVSAQAFEIEQLVCSIIGQSEEDHESSADTHVEAFRSVWCETNPAQTASETIGKWKLPGRTEMQDWLEGS